jgi:hypothetical protein
VSDNQWNVTEQVPPIGLERVLNEHTSQGNEIYAIVPHPQYNTVTVVSRKNLDGDLATLFTAEDANALLVNILRNWNPEKWARLASAILDRLPDELRHDIAHLPAQKEE